MGVSILEGNKAERIAAALETIADGSGGGGGTTNYNALSNKPQINGVTLSGNKSLDDLGIAAEEDIPDVSGFYTKPETGIPTSDLAEGVIPDVSGFYTKPETGIPASDLAEGVIPEDIGGGKPTIYCWGDSLTEGVGAWIMPPDGHNAYMAFGYPEWVGKSYDVVNLGARSEDLITIMSRQGADPIVFQSGFTIPASKSTPVKVGTVTQIYNLTAGTGFTTASGAMVKPNKEVESAGINPCMIAGVEGIFYREIGSSPLSNEGSYDYYFKRLEDGDAVTVPANTQLETYAMRYYRNGVAIFWVGANGGFSGVMDYAQKISAMIEYGEYDDYLIIISRELSGTDLETIKTEFTDEKGFCHVICLMDELPFRGYAMAGIPYESIDTSGWTTTDVIKKNAPLLCEYLSGQTGENQYGALHYSCWGYKAIGKLVVEKLGKMDLDKHSGGGGGGDEDDHDEYGTLLYKLAAPRTLNGTNYINTKVKLFEDVDADWTVAVKWSGVPNCPNGLPYNIFCCSKDGIWTGILFRYYSEWGANVLVGKGAFNVPDAGNNAYEHHDGSENVVVIVKSGSNYTAFVNSTDKLYNSTLVYALDPEDAFDLPLIIGARYNAEGTEVQYKTAIVVEDVRVYDSALEEADAIDLYNELAGN